MKNHRKNHRDRYLWFRPETRIIWFRMAIPKAVQDRLGTTPYTCSLETSDRREAAMKAGKIRAELFEQWGLVGGAPAPKQASSDPISIAVNVAYDGVLAGMEEGRRHWPSDDAGYSAKLVEREADLRRLTRKARDGNLEQWEAVADRAIAARGIAIVKGSSEYSSFVAAIAEASLDAIGVFNRTHAGELDAAPRSALVIGAKERDAAKAKAGETLAELFEAWASEMLAKGEKRSDTINQDRKVILQFASFVGPDRDVRSITPNDIADYRDTMRNLPPKWMSKRELRDLDMRAAAAKARSGDMPQTAYTTINKHLSTISPLYKWLGGQPKWAGMRNPCDGLFHAKVKGKNRRPSFDTSALNKMLSSPLFTGFLADDREHVRGNVRADDWRYWIPLAAMFSGARIGEIAQLRIGDVNTQFGVWFIHIRHEEKDGLTTKSGKSRFAAMHPTLERIGFVSFRQRRLEDAGGDLDAPMFPELERNARGQISGMASRWWRDYLAAIGVKDGAAQGGDGFGAHSFRHTLTDRLRVEAELLDTQIAVCLGHSEKSTTGGYGSISQGTVNMLKGYMDGVRFDGVNFDHLIAAEEARQGVRMAA